MQDSSSDAGLRPELRYLHESSKNHHAVLLYASNAPSAGDPGPDTDGHGCENAHWPASCVNECGVDDDGDNEEEDDDYDDKAEVDIGTDANAHVGLRQCRYGIDDYPGDVLGVVDAENTDDDAGDAGVDGPD